MGTVMRPLTAVISLTLVLAATPVPEETDLDRLQGTWLAVSFEEEGEVLSAKDVPRTTLTVKKDRYTFVRGPLVIKGTVKLDPGQKPKAIDRTATEGDCKGKVQLGIYELDKDTLRWCCVGPYDRERPKEFVTKKGSSAGLITFKREKP
jgi:uncharacterized protein (TIGR03067 family)